MFIDTAVTCSKTCLVQQLEALNGIGDLLVANNDLGDEAEVSVSDI